MPAAAIKMYIVDDEPSVRTAYARLGRSAGMATQTFASLADFMRAEIRDDDACVICDVCMPGRSGLELPDLLARAGRTLPVIFVTAHDTQETRTIARRVGAAGYFRKPVDDQALLDAVAWAVSRRTTP